MKANDGKNITIQTQGKRVTKVNVIFLILASSGCLGVPGNPNSEQEVGFLKLLYNVQ